MSFFPRDLAAPAASPAVDWDEPNCPLCAGRRWAQLIEAPDRLDAERGLWFAVVQCQACGLCFTNPRPSPVSIGRFYPADYQPHRRPKPGRNGRPRTQRRHGTSWGRRGWKGLPWHGDGRLLDFGCGGGTFLARMHRRGWKVAGVDVSPDVVHRIRTELGLPAFTGSLPHPALEPGSFDVITMWHSLEHVHEPREVLRQAYDLLAPGGRLVVAVPNIDSLPFRWFGRAWFALDLPRHLTHFTPQTLRWMLERVGFHVGPVRMIRRSSWLRSSAALARRQGAAPPWGRLLGNRTVSGLASWMACVFGRSDCMQVVAERGD